MALLGFLSVPAQRSVICLIAYLRELGSEHAMSWLGLAWLSLAWPDLTYELFDSLNLFFLVAAVTRFSAWDQQWLGVAYCSCIVTKNCDLLDSIS